MPETFQITRVRHDPYYNMPFAHLHPLYEIYYLISGARKIFLDDSLYLLEKGDLVFIPVNALHKTSYINDRPHERIAINFSDAAVPDITPSVFSAVFQRLFRPEPVIHITAMHRDYIEGLLGRMLSEYEQRDDYSDINIKNCLQELIIFLIRYVHHKDSEFFQSMDATDSLVQDAARYIRTNYMKDLSLGEVAAYVNISPTYFSKKFKASTGFGYKEYLTNVRIQEASDMLLETNASISEIAQRCGFNDSDYFGIAFKKSKGISPLKYRKNNFRMPLVSGNQTEGS